MPNANVFELESCMADAARYCAEAPSDPVNELFWPRIAAAQRRWDESVAESERVHIVWRTEQREELVSRKELAKALRRSIAELGRIGAVGYPEERVLYWDEVKLEAAVERMITYLRAHAHDLPFAREHIETFERHMSAGRAELRESEHALRNFQRAISMRREAMHEVMAVIGEYRKALRRALGKNHPGYRSIRWPYAIASDEGVLF